MRWATTAAARERRDDERTARRDWCEPSPRPCVMRSARKSTRVAQRAKSREAIPQGTEKRDWTRQQSFTLKDGSGKCGRIYTTFRKMMVELKLVQNEPFTKNQKQFQDELARGKHRPHAQKDFVKVTPKTCGCPGGSSRSSFDQPMRKVHSHVNRIGHHPHWRSLSKRDDDGALYTVSLQIVLYAEGAVAEACRRRDSLLRALCRYLRRPLELVPR